MTMRQITLGIAALLSIICTLDGHFTAGAIYVAAGLVIINMRGAE